VSKSITSKFVSTSGLSGMRVGEEVQWLAGRVRGPCSRGSSQSRRGTSVPGKSSSDPLRRYVSQPVSRETWM